ncbi:DUF6265 family protein [Pleionea mediterranea]|uniref:DUF6265 domain-containing protein n=1 Tax=Pleionea mediterranea TaxID=523701 RepID=A0A316F7Y2_9GAMM|nr:DUF6265 family protein [Pleionea mediterranea]PWK42805.1 hypothetical protein C8D97_1177 [Pleionea mediterranea]
MMIKSKTTSSMIIMMLFSPVALAVDCKSMASLLPIVGHWQSKDDAKPSDNSQVTEEIWQQVSDNTLEGKGRVVVNGQASTTEWLRLVKMDNAIFYIAKPKQNERPVAFKLTECSEKRWVFTNKHHDFPKQIEYQLKSSKKLLVNVTGDGNGFSIHFDSKN